MPAVLYLRAIGVGASSVAALLQATSLPVTVTPAHIALVLEALLPVNAAALICNAAEGGAGATAANTTLASRLSGGAAGCNPDYSIWTIGSRTVWTPVKDFVIGAEILYTQHHSWLNGQTYTGTVAPGFKPNAVYEIKNEGFLSGLFTVRRYF